MKTTTIAHKGEVPEADVLGRKAAEAEARNEPKAAIELLNRARDLRLRTRHYDRAFTEGEWATKRRAMDRGEHDIVEVRRGKAWAESEEKWLIVGVAGKEAEGKLLVVWEFNDENCAQAIATTLNAMVLADVMHGIAEDERAA